MNNGLKYALIFPGGALFGGLAQAALRRNNINLKPMAADLLSRGMDVKDAVLAKVEAVKENHADILCMSALLTTTMTYMKEVIQALEEAGIRNQVKVMIGGAPVSQGFADEIGADGYSDNANTAVAVAKELIGNKK